MPKVNKEYLAKLSALDEEDGFDPMDFTIEDIEAIENSSDFSAKYKEFYDDIKTSSIIHKEDW